MADHRVSCTVPLMKILMARPYTASKAAVNAFSEVLALEVEPFNVRVRIVLPGRAPGTSFGQNARARLQSGTPMPIRSWRNASSHHGSRIQDRSLTREMSPKPFGAQRRIRPVGCVCLLEQTR